MKLNLLAYFVARSRLQSTMRERPQLPGKLSAKADSAFPSRFRR